MKYFTFKDFIYYNYPCKSCGSRENQLFLDFYQDHINMVNQKECIVDFKNNKLSVNLKKTYYNFMDLIINPVNNSYVLKTNDANIFNEFQSMIKENNIRLSSNCLHCNTFVGSELLKFILDKNIIEPLQINDEWVELKYEGRKIQIFTRNNISEMYVERSSQINIPYTPLSAFKNKNELSDFLKLVLTFS